MTEIFSAVLTQYGEDVTISNTSGTVSAKAFIQSTADRTKAWPFEATPLGTVDDRQWICLSRAKLAAGDTVTGTSGTFLVQNSAPYYLGAELSHWWAVLTPRKESAG